MKPVHRKSPRVGIAYLWKEEPELERPSVKEKGSRKEQARVDVTSSLLKISLASCLRLLAGACESLESGQEFTSCS